MVNNSKPSGALVAGAGIIIVLLLGGTAALTGLVSGVSGKPAEASERERFVQNPPAPGQPGANPCFTDGGGNREETTPDHVRDYFQMIGLTLKEHGHPWFLEYEAKWKEVQELVGVVLRKHQLVDPTAPYWAKTAWCPGFDVADNGSKVERKAEWVSDKPVQFPVHKKYWVLWEDDDVIVGILEDCHNLVVIRKYPAPPPSETTVATPGTNPPTQPPGTITPPETTLTPKDPSEDVNVNPSVPPAVRGPGSTPVGGNPGPATDPVDSPTGCNGPCPVPTNVSTTTSTVPSAGSGTSGDGSTLPPGGSAGVSNPQPANPTSVPEPSVTGDPGGF